MKITIEISDTAIQSHILDIESCVGIVLTPEQFIDVCKTIGWDINNIHEYGFGDTTDREDFVEKFVTKVLKFQKVPTYGEEKNNNIDMEKYWKDLADKAIVMGYKGSLR